MDRDAPRPSIPPDVLVEHAAFVRSLAFAIVRDAADADDVAQDAIARGLTTGPSDPAAHRPWLIAVVRNFARRLVRRESRLSDRERRASRPESTGSTVDAVARQETLHAVANAVDSLDPSAREVVLLRHYDGLPPREIASRLGVPVETVKKRLLRAHHVLRDRLDVGDERERGRRRSALGAFAGVDFGSKSVAAAAAGGLVMAWSGKTVALGALGLLALGVGVWGTLRGSDGGGGGGGTTNPMTALSSDVARSMDLAASGKATGPPSLVATPPTPADEVAGSWVPLEFGRIRFRLPRELVRQRVGPPDWRLPEAGRWVGPVRGATAASWSIVSARDADTWLARLSDVTEAGMSIGRREGRVSRGREAADGRAARVRVIRLAPLDGYEEPFAFISSLPADASVEADDTIDLIVSGVRVAPLPTGMLAATGDVPGDRIEVAVFIDGVPAAGKVTLERLGEAIVQDDGRWGLPRGPPKEFPLSADGRARMDRLEAGYYEVTVGSPTIGSHRITTTVSGNAQEPHPRLVLALGPFVVRGRAFGRDGRPAVGATVLFNASVGAYGPLIVVGETRVDADGRYELRGLPRLAGRAELVLPPIDGMPQAPRAAMVHPGGTNPMEIDLGDERPLTTWRGLLLDASGHPVNGRATLCLVRTRPEHGCTVNEDTIETRKDGRFEARIEPGRYRVTGTLNGLDGSMRSIAALDLEIPSIGVERDVVVGNGKLTAHVREADASLAVGVEMHLEPIGATGGWSMNRGIWDGTATFDGLPAGRYRVSVTGLSVTLVGGGAPEVDVKDPPGAPDVDVELHPPEAVAPPK